MPVPGAVTDPTSITTTDVDVAVDGATMPAYLARPVRPGPRPGIVVIHEAFGLNDHIRDLTRRFAAAGYDALAPDLYHRVGPPDPNDMQTVMQKMFAMADADVVRDIEAAARYLKALDGSNGRAGCIGFCSGGRQTLLAACSTSVLDAAVDCWGGMIDRAAPDAERTELRPTPVIDLVENLGCPLFAVGGAEDQNPSPAVLEELRTRLAKLSVPSQVKIFPDAGHAFLADYRPSYREAQAHELWVDVLAFFEAHLKSA